MALVRIPKAFLDDHANRELPTPEVIKETSRHYYIRRGDPAFDELLEDAEYYSGPGAPDWAEGFGLRSSAAHTANAMRSDQ